MSDAPNPAERAAVAVRDAPWWKKALAVAGAILAGLLAVCGAILGFLFVTRRLPQPSPDGEATPEGRALAETQRLLAEEKVKRAGAEETRDLLAIDGRRATLEGTVGTVVEAKKEAARDEERKDLRRAGSSTADLLDDIVNERDGGKPGT